MSGLRLSRVTAVLAFSLWIAGHGCQLVAADPDDHLLPTKMPPLKLPMPGGTVQGFTTQVEIADDGGPGYIAVQIDIKAVGTFAADRRFTYQLQSFPGGYSPPGNGLRYNIPVNVSQGDKSKRVVRYLPKWSVGDGFQLQVFADDRPLQDYQAVVGSQLRQRKRPPLQPIHAQNQLHWLFVQDTDNVNAMGVQTQPNLILTTLDPAQWISRLTAMDEFLATASGNPDLSRMVTTTGRLELPTDWRGYLRHDAIVISQRTIEYLRSNAPQRWQAIRDWVLNGGTVVAYDAVSDRSTADVLDFFVTPSDHKDTVASAAFKIEQAFESVRSQYSVSENEITAHVKVQHFKPDRWSQLISLAPVGGGLVIGLQDPSAVQFPSLLHGLIVSELVGYRRAPAVRRGVDPLIGDGRFRRWLIPGVAQPPVYTFMCLLTCFVILVGPVAYRRTTKYGRGYLMFAIAPVLAMTTTLAMFGYGIVADGFGTTARIRQLTWVDGASGDAGERVRSTYFAGVRPSMGLTFGPDAEVYQYPENYGASWEDLNENASTILGTVRVTEASQVFDNSFLPSRQQRQFVVQQPRRKIGRLAMNPTTLDSGQPPTVSSSFKFTLRDVVLRDQSGRYWAASRVPAGTDGSTPCMTLTLKEASKALGDLYNRYRPIAEVSAARNRSRYRRDTRDLITTANEELFSSTSVIKDGVFEQWLQKYLQTDGELPRSSFVALADVSEDVVAVEETELVESVRYVFGTLP